MPDHCCAVNCTNRRGALSKSERTITFHRFPTDSRRILWVRNVRRARADGGRWEPNTRDVLCSAHFKEEAFDRTGQITRLRADAIPELFEFPPHLQPQKKMERSRRTSQNACTASVLSGATSLVQPSVITADNSVMQDHSYQLPDALNLKKRLDRVDDHRQQLERQLRNARHREKRARLNCTVLLNDLKQQNLVNEELLSKLEAFSEFPVDIFKRPASSYTEEQRAFALTLHLYSPKAYEYLRSEKNIPLPHPRTLCRWLETVESKPGFNMAVVETLKERALKEPDVYKHCTLMLDAMAVKTHIEHDPVRGTMVGFCDLGEGGDPTQEAKEALVIMAVGLRGRWKIPLAYFFTRSVGGAVQTRLILHALHTLHEAGLVVWCITMDGHATNVAMCRMLGCHLDPGNLKTSFLDSASQRRVFVFFDACHMLKLVRNMLEMFSLLESEGGRVSWAHIKALQDLQADCGLRAANKLSHHHIQFKNQKMKMSLAAQVISDSVANALRLANSLKIPGFEDCQGTARFLEMFNMLFDVFNSRNLRCVGHKKPIMERNWTHVRENLLQMKAYILSLKAADGVPVHSTRRFMSTVGFLINIESLLEMVPGVLEIQPFLLTYRMSQDHLELFFSAVRKAGGSNNNPTCREFTAIFRRLIVHAGVKPGKKGNVVEMDDTKMLNIPTQRTTLTTDSVSVCDITSPFEDSSVDHAYAQSVVSGATGLFLQNIVTYIAGFVVRKAMLKVLCAECRGCLVTTPSDSCNLDTYHLLVLKNKGGLVVPSEGVVEVLLRAEKALRQTMNVLSARSAVSQKTIQYIVKRDYGTCDPLGLGSHILETQDGIDNHFFDLLELLVSIYYNLRQRHVARIHTARVKATSTRQKLTKLILFKGD